MDSEFFQLADLTDLGTDLFESAIEQFEEINFDVFAYCQIFSSSGSDKAMGFCVHKLFQKYDLYRKYHISCETLLNFS